MKMFNDYEEHYKNLKEEVNLSSLFILDLTNACFPKGKKTDKFTAVFNKILYNNK